MSRIISLALLVICASFSARVYADHASDWRRQVIYFALIDRFANGDRTNDRAHGHAECNDASNPHTYQGGDLAGLTDKLDYITYLGATTLWLSPLYKGVAAKEGDNCGFPGYWADFAQPYELALDPRFGNAEEFDRLIENSHDRGMKVILDMVVNHAGYGATLTQQRPDWFTDVGSCHLQGPVEIYCPLAGLPDFDHRRADVRNYLVDLHRTWLQRFPFDGIRMDTVKHVEPSYFQSHWIPAMREERTDLFVLGELLDEQSWEPYDRYLLAGFDGLFNFHVRRGLIESFAKGHSVDIAAAKMQETMNRFGEERAAYMVNLLDNHDVPRFVQEIPFGIPSEDARKRYLLAITALLTLPGIPQIYYGNELGMDGGSDPHNRRFMPLWAFEPEQRRGPHSGHLERPDVIFDHMRRVLAIRQSTPSLQVGSYREIWRQNGPRNANVWAFLRTAPGEGSPAIVALNNGYRPPDAPLPINVLGSIPDGTVLEDALGQAGIPALVVREGRVDLSLPGQSAVILIPRT